MNDVQREFLMKFATLASYIRVLMYSCSTWEHPFDSGDLTGSASSK